MQELRCLLVCVCLWGEGGYLDFFLSWMTVRVSQSHSCPIFVLVQARRVVLINISLSLHTGVGNFRGAKQ